MPDPKFIDARTVLIADMNPDKVIESISAAIDFYRKVYGEPKRVWVNKKDVPDEIQEVGGFKIERRGGCTTKRIMIL